jgi:Protein of unknown function (DUF2800)
MWRFESSIAGLRTAETGTWEEMREHARKAALTFSGPERPTVLRMVAEAVPERPWSCSGAACSLRITGPFLREETMSTLVSVEALQHADREHADLAASNCHIWWNCAGMLNLMRKLNPPKRTSQEAEKGTAAHEVAHLCLLKGQDAIEMVDRTFNGVVVDETMAYNVQKYLDLCRSFITPDSECFTEKKFSLRKLTPPEPMFGTSDFGAIFRKLRKLVIVDYKNGYIYVDPTTPQLKYYVLGVLCSLPEDVHIETIEVYIVQPNGRGPDVKTATYTVAEIFLWHLDLLQHARATQDPNAPRNAGSWCKFCPNAGMCQTQADAAMEAAQLEFVAEPVPGTELVTYNAVEVRRLTPEQLGALKLKFSLVEDFMKAVDQTISELISSGVDVPYWKLISGLGHRQWNNPDYTANKLTGSWGLDENAIWERKLVSPATVEKLLRPKLRELGIKGKKADEMLTQALGPLTTRPNTAPRLVRDTDPAPALLARGDEFTAEPLPEQP